MKRHLLHIFYMLALLLGVAFHALANDRGATGWTIVESYILPEGASGLAFDGSYLYCGIYGVNGGWIYRIDPATGAYTPFFVGEQEDAFGLTYDGQNLWTTDHVGSSTTPAFAMKLDWNGDILSQFDMPDHYMSGIAYDNGDFWVARYYDDPGHLYKVSETGMVIHQFDGPDDQPWDLAMQDGNIWIADYYGNMLYYVDSATGAVISSNPSEGEDPSGIVWDGKHLWYCDNGDNWDEDMLYKVDLQGSGSPEVIIADPTHDFGNVAIGTINVWNVLIANTGTAALSISEVYFGMTTELSCPAIFPVVIQPGNTAFLPIEYSPGFPVPISVTASVISNDPIHPSEDLFITGHGLFSKPTLFVADTYHNFGPVRVDALTRWDIEVTSMGLAPLIIEGMTSDNPHFVIDQALNFPMTLDPLQTTTLGVWFQPTSEDVESASVLVYSNDNQDPTISLIGSGVDTTYPIGNQLWSTQFTDDWDNSFKALSPIPDINGDGISDVIGCSEDNYIRAFNGNADQTADVIWSHEIYSGNIYSGKGLDIVEDVDGDGYSDVVVGATGGARLIRMLSGKTGEMLWTYYTNAVGNGGWVYQVDGSRDFNGDGTIDVLACAGDDGDDSGPKRAYCFDGIDGTLLWEYPVGGPVFAIIAVDDFTGDGIPDAVAGASDQWETEGLAIGLNGATGQSEWSFPTDGSSVWSLAQIGNVNFDGIKDVMVGDFYGDYYALSSTTGNELYNGTGLGILTGFTRIDDVNGDGHPDVVPEHFYNFVRVISGKDGTAIWTTSVIDSPTVSEVAHDFNSDGINDLVVGTLFSDNYTYFLDGANGDVLHSANFGTPIDSITAIPDIVGDGSWELVAGGRDGTIACYSGGIDAVIYNPADINEDGMVGVIDLLIVIDQWGQTDSPADINGDGIVSVSDLLLVVDNWGQ